ncbi:MAG TPA: RHS repeat-associated core domain-containing protein [Oculatellaceae cyanobacterium]
MDTHTSMAENLELAKSLTDFKNRQDPEDISALKHFIESHPKSRWSVSLLVSLGQERLETGYISEALQLWNRAWDMSKQVHSPKQRAVANEALASLVSLESRLGLMSSLKQHLSEAQTRKFTGSAAQRIKDASDGLWTMQHHPEIAFKCGPFAVNTLSYFGSPTKAIGCSETIKKAASGTNGTNLSQLKDWADKLGLKTQLAKRSKGSKIIVPSVVHYSVGHFAAITDNDGGRYQIQDPTFGDEGHFRVTSKAIDSEMDGYCLVPTGPLPAGWQALTQKEGESVWGKGVASSRDPGKTPGCPHKCPVCPCPRTGMAAASAFAMNATLNIGDTPLFYNPPIGPAMSMNANYNFNEGYQPSTFTFTNLGPDWSFNWVSYLTVDASQNVNVRTRGGGYEIYNYVSSSYSPALVGQAQIVNLGGGSWQRVMPDGSAENFTLSDGTNTYMTSVADPQGNAVSISYDGNYRVTGITDACGNASAVTYVSNVPGNAGFYKIAGITDAFGRSASFSYDTTTTFLTGITDAAGNQSKFSYDTSSSFINVMTTPYGSTSFYKYVPQGGAPTYPPTGLRFSFPDGSQSVIENWIGEQKETYYWDREAIAQYPCDPINLNYSHCQSTRWLWEQATNAQAPVANWVRSALEAPVVNFYPGENNQDYCGTSDKPILVAKNLTGFKETATLSGSVTAGDILGIQISDQLMPGSSETVHYTVKTGDTLATIAAGLAAAVNSDWSLQAFGISATASSASVIISSQSYNQTAYTSASVGSPTETITFAVGPNPAGVATFSGSATSGDVLSISVHDTALPGGLETVSYTVQPGDTLATITQQLAVALNADTNLRSIGLISIWLIPTWIPSTNPLLGIQSNSSNSTTYSASVSSGATEAISLGSTVNGLVQQTFYQRNAIGNITQKIDPIGRIVNYTYASNLIDLTEASVPASPSSYLIGQWAYANPSAPHRVTLYTDGSGQQTHYTYNSLAELATIVDANSNTTTFSHDANGYLTQIQGPLSGSQDVTIFSYFGYGLPFTITDSEGYIQTFAYDSLNRSTGTTYPDGTSDTTTYNRLDAVLKTDRIGRSTAYSYDSLDQLSSEVDPAGRKTSYCWCSCGSLMALTDPLNQTTTWQHDLEGRTIKKVYADGTSVSTTYEPTTDRVSTVTDALNQVKHFIYNFDDTLCVKSYSNVVNPTSTVQTEFDTIFARVTSVRNGWGAYNYAYNPYFTGSAVTTGGGRLSSISNTVIPNSQITYSYDALGRTTNRFINGSSNSTSWSYDAMSRVTSEQNSLGTFNYTYVDDTVGSSKGTTRLAAISYPNSQVTNFSYYGNTGDQRLQQISNLNPSGGILSQFNYAYDSASEITLWQQQQNGNSEFHNLQYDLASQLTSDLVGSGAPQPPYGRQLSYNYDCASNRRSVQSSSMQTVRIGGTVTAGDTVTITVSDPGLSGGTESVAYSVQSGDTLASISAKLAASITSDSNLLTLGVNAVSNSNSIFIKSTSNNITTYSSTISSGGTETVSFTIYKNGNTNAIVGGTKTTGDVLTIKVVDPSLSGGSTSVSYTVASSDTLSSIASGLKSAINGNSSLAALGVGSTSFGPVVNITSSSTTVTNYLTSLSSGATESLSLVVNQNQNMTAVLSGTVTSGDVLTLRFYDAGLTGGTETVSHTVLSTDTLTSIATALTTSINGDSNLAAIGATAASAGSVITLSSDSINPTTYRQSISSAGTEIINVFAAINSTQTAVIGGSSTAGDVLTIVVYDPSLSGGKETVSYTVQSTDTLPSIAASLASAINADSHLNTIGVSATSVSTVVNLSSASMNNTGYVQSTSSGATETLTLNNTTGVQQAAFNNVNELTSLLPGGPVSFQGTTANPVKSIVVNPSQSATISGTVTPGDVLWLGVHDKGLSQAANVSHTVLSGDSTSSIATALTSAINSNTSLSTLGVKASSVNAVITLTSSSTNATSFTQSVSSGATESITLGASSGAPATIRPSEAFIANPALSGGTNLALVTGTSGGGSNSTNTYPVKLGSGTTQSLTFDANGNMTNDGTNTYAWDAENRLIQINYPGSGNNSQFTYDPYGHNVKIVEVLGGSATSTRQFVWSGNAMREARDSSSNIVSQYFNRGQITSGISYFYELTQRGDVVGVTNSSAALVSSFSYDAYGRPTILSGSFVPDFGFTGLYFHQRSGLNLAVYRAYSPTLGRWINRDPSAERASINLYSYAGNSPIERIDRLGKCWIIVWVLLGSTIVLSSCSQGDESDNPGGSTDPGSGEKSGSGGDSSGGEPDTTPQGNPIPKPDPGIDELRKRTCDDDRRRLEQRRLDPDPTDRRNFRQPDGRVKTFTPN